MRLIHAGQLQQLVKLSSKANLPWICYKIIILKQKIGFGTEKVTIWIEMVKLS
jgi:hypothetical protein